MHRIKSFKILGLIEIKVKEILIKDPPLVFEFHGQFLEFYLFNFAFNFIFLWRFGSYIFLNL